MANVGTYKRCGCKDPGTGRQLGSQCPKLRRGDRSWNPRHGTWYGKAELAPGPDGRRQALAQGGFATRDDCDGWFAAALQLLAIPEPDRHEDRAAIKALVKAAGSDIRRLPDPADIERRYSHGAAYEAGTVAEYLTRWLAARKAAEEIRTTTGRGYESHIRVWIIPAIGRLRIDRLRASDVKEVFTRIAASNEALAAARESPDPEVRRLVAGRQPCGPVTQQRIRATLRKALADAAQPDEALVTQNAARAVRLPPPSPARPRIWTAAREVAFWKGLREDGYDGLKKDAQFRLWRRATARPGRVMVWRPSDAGAFLDYAEGLDDPLISFWHVVIFRGLRRGEACGQRMDDLELDGDAPGLEVTSEITTANWQPVHSRPKTAGSDATVALDPDSIATIRRRMDQREADRESWGDGWAETGRLWTLQNGEELHPDKVSVRFQRLAWHAGLVPIRFQDLRHCAATLAHAAGATDRDVMQLMRHSSITVTMNTYTSVFADLDRELAARMVRLVPRAGQKRQPGKALPGGDAQAGAAG